VSISITSRVANPLSAARRRRVRLVSRASFITTSVRASLAPSTRTEPFQQFTPEPSGADDEHADVLAEQARDVFSRLKIWTGESPTAS
jgi:hypothetical protein